LLQRARALPKNFVEKVDIEKMAKIYRVHRNAAEFDAAYIKNLEMSEVVGLESPTLPQTREQRPHRRRDAAATHGLDGAFVLHASFVKTVYLVFKSV